MLAEGLKSPRKRQTPSQRRASSPADLSRRLLSLAEEVSEDEMSEDGERENENHVLVGERHPWCLVFSCVLWPFVELAPRASSRVTPPQRHRQLSH